MERFRGRLMDGDRVLFDEIEGSLAIEEGPGLREWRGRLWLPDDAQVRPGDRYCLIRDDGRAGELVVESSAPGASGGMSRRSRATAASSDGRDGPGPAGVAPLRADDAAGQLRGIVAWSDLAPHVSEASPGRIGGEVAERR